MIRIVGIGSPFGDDQVAWRVIESLRQLLPAAIELIALDRPGVALVNWMQGVSWLILIDALSSGAPPGSVITIDPQVLAAEDGRFSSHDLRLRESLHLAASLGCLPARIDIYAIEAATLEGEGLSADAAAGAAQLSQQLVEMVRYSHARCSGTSEAASLNPSSDP